MFVVIVSFACIDRQSRAGIFPKDLKKATQMVRLIHFSKDLKEATQMVRLMHFSKDIKKATDTVRLMHAQGVSGEVVLVDHVKTEQSTTIRNLKGWEDTVLWSPYGNEGMGYKNFACVESVKADTPVTLGISRPCEKFLCFRFLTCLHCSEGG